MTIYDQLYLNDMKTCNAYIILYIDILYSLEDYYKIIMTIQGQDVYALKNE